jgi:hypothetical protein
LPKKYMSLSRLAPPKAPNPMLLTLAGIVAEVSAVASLKV